MEVKLNITGAPREVGSRPAVSSPRPAPRTDSASFPDAAAVNAALRATPAVRPEAVARAQALTANVAYPPAETLQAIATLLAMKLGESDE